jgi:hypothetical protein
MSLGWFTHLKSRRCTTGQIAIPRFDAREAILDRPVWVWRRTITNYLSMTGVSQKGVWGVVPRVDLYYDDEDSYCG